MEQIGTVYLIHFEQPYAAHARHYIGFTTLPVEQRLARHADGNGSKLLRAVTAAGIAYSVVKVWEGTTKAFERRLHSRKDTPRFCPVCRQDRKA